MHTTETLKNHPHIDPRYFPTLEARREAQAINRDIRQMERTTGKPMQRAFVPKQVGRYMPHTGAKERARHAHKTTLGPNASRALQETV